MRGGIGLAFERGGHGMFKDRSMRILVGHLLAFVAITAICAGLNLWLSPAALWWPWVLIGWGVAVATHAFALLLRKMRRRERIVTRVRVDRKARAFAVHLFAYVAVVLVLLYVNLTLTPKVLWFYWVALGWGVGVAFHGWCALFRRRKPTAAESGSLPTHRAKTKPVEAKPQRPEKKPARKRTPAKRKPKTGEG